MNCVSSISKIKSDNYFGLLLIVRKRPKTWSIEPKHWNFTDIFRFSWYNGTKVFCKRYFPQIHLAHISV